MMCEYKDKVLVFTYPKIGDSAPTAQELSSIFWTDDTSLDDVHADDFFTGDDDTYRVRTHDDWGGYKDDEMGDDDVNNSGGSDDVIAGDDDDAIDGDDDLHIFEPDPITSNGRTLHVEQVIIPAFSLNEVLVAVDKEITPPIAVSGPLRTVTVNFQDLSNDRTFSGSDISNSIIVRITNKEGHVIQIGGKSSSEIDNYSSWPRSWRNMQLSKVGVTREMKVPMAASTNMDKFRIQVSVLHSISTETVGGVLSLGFEVTQPSNGLSWFLILSIGVAIVTCVTVVRSRLLFKSSEHKYQHIPVSSVHGGDSDVEMTIKTGNVNVQNTNNQGDYAPTNAGYQTI
jgi:hypothetical protein